MRYLYIFEDGEVYQSSNPPLDGDIHAVKEGYVNVIRIADEGPFGHQSSPVGNQGPVGVVFEEMNTDETWGVIEIAKVKNDLNGEQYHR